MNECLVTRLKASVNEALPKLGTIVFKANPNETSTSGKKFVNFISPGEIQRAKEENREWEYSVGDGGYFALSSLTVNLGTTIKSSDLSKIPSGEGVYIVNDTGLKVTVECKGKYQIPTIFGYFDEVKEYNNINDIVGYFTGEKCIIYNLTSTEPFKGFNGDVSNVIDFRCFVGSNLVFTKEMIAPLTNQKLRLNVALDNGGAIPKNCESYNGKVFSWNRGDRANSSFVNMISGVSFVKFEHITNALIDLATCSNLNNRTSLGLVFYCEAGNYTPTSAATEAINTLKAAGYSITITGVKY